MIYFVQHGEGGAIKIGTARNVRARIDAIQTSAPVRLRLLAVIDGGVREERELHDRFRKDRIHGEWFHPSPPLIEHIAGIEPGKSVRVSVGKRIRRRHSGSIYQRTCDGRWVATVSLGYQGEKRVRKCVYGIRRSEVESKLRAMMRQKEKPTLQEPG